MYRNFSLAAAGLALAGALAATPASAAMKPGEYLNGQWGSQAGGGRGATLTFVPSPGGGGTLFGLVFAYNEMSGENTWLLVQADFLEHQFQSSGEIFALEGGSFSNPPVDPTQSSIGTFTVTLNSCGSIVYDFDFDESSGFPDETYELENLRARTTNGEFPQCPYTEEFTGCPSFATTLSEERRECGISGALLDQDIVLTNDTTWVLTGATEIGAPNANSSTLTIEPGTVITADPTANGFIYVHAGSKIFADGTPAAPIVLTSANDGFETGAPAPVPGDTGGLAVAGNAPCNSNPGVQGGCNSEFASGSQVLTYGGDDPADSSGSISYFQIRYAGIEVAPNEEVNSFTFLGVGNGTNVHNIQAYRSLDDGIEFFGGNVNVRYGVFTNGQDDFIDWDEGWSGKFQHALIVVTDEPGAGAGIEGANNGDNFDALPRATPVLSNLTIVNVNPDSDDDGIQLKEGSGGQIWNSVVQGFNGACINLRDIATFDAAGSPESPSGTLAFAGDIVDGCPTLFQTEDGAPFTTEAFYNSSAFPNNLVTDPMLDGTTFEPLPGSPALDNGVRVVDLETGEPLEFFEYTPYSGAFSGQRDWTYPWTFDPFGEYQP